MSPCRGDSIGAACIRKSQYIQGGSALRVQLLPYSSRLKRLRQRREGRGQPSYIISQHHSLDLQAGGIEISRHCSQDTRRKIYQRGALSRSCRLIPMHLLNTVLPEGWEFSPTAEAAALRASWWRTDVSRRSFQHTRHDMHMVAPLLYAFFPIELSERSYTLACSLL